MRKALLAVAVLLGLVACSGDDLATGTIEVTAEDFTFSGVPEKVATGAEFTLTNKPGGEVHEIVVFRIADGEDRTIEELLELPDEEVESLVEFKGVLVALPGEEGFNPEGEGNSIAVDQSGRYAVLCFIPEGTTHEDLEGDGPPHAFLGMIAEFSAQAS